MDWDLWASSYDQDAQESSYCMPPGRKRDLYIGYGYALDGIEEDALNEKSCIQVLRILITKADSDIDELEQDLVSLQSQLAWAEYEEWPELCCNALRDKINGLDTAIRSLSNTDENDIEVQLQMHKEPAERVHEILRTLLRNYFQEKDGQPLDTIALVSSSNVIKPAAGLLDENETLSNISSSISTKEETEEASITGKCTSSNLSLKLQENTANYPDIIEPADGTVKTLGEDPVLHLIDRSKNKKKLSSSNVKVMSGEIEEHNSTSMVDDIVLGASSNSERKSTDHGKEVKPAKPIGKGSSSEVIGDAAGRPLETFDSNVIGNEEAKKHKSVATDKRKILNSSSNSKGEGNFRRTDKPANAIVKSIKAEALSNTTGLNRREKGSDSDLGALRQAESGNSDLELKLSDFAENIVRKKCFKGLKIAANDKIDALDSSLKAECKRKNPLLKVDVQEAGFTKTGHSTSPLDQRRREATKLQLMEEGKSQAEDIQKVEGATVDKKPILNVSLGLQKQKGKRKIESDTPQVREPALSSIRILSNTSSTKSKSKEKSGDSTNNFILNQSLSRKVTKRPVPPWQSEATERSFVHDDCKSSVLDAQNKRKRTNFPSNVKIRDSALYVSLLNFPGNATASGSKENLQMIKSYSYDDSQANALALVPVPCAVINLSNLTLNDLRAIAKQLKLRKYHKLRKQVLIELLLEKLG